MGKTRLARELADTARARGMSVLWGTCVHFAASEAPYAPLTGAVRRWARSRPPSPAGEAGRFFLRLTTGAATSAEGVVTSAAVMQAADELVDALSDDAPTLWVVDDLHWSDATSRDLLAYVVSGLDRHRIGLLLLVRAEDRSEGHPLNEWLADLRRHPAVSEVTLERLSEEATDALVAQIRGATPALALASAIYERTEGNPYFTELYVKGLDPDATVAPERTPHGLLDAVSARWHSLPPPARELARLLALGGRPRSLGVLRQVMMASGSSIVDLSPAVADGVQGGVLTYVDDQVWFRHPLLRDVLTRDSGTAKASSVHAAYAATLVNLDDGSPQDAADIAVHWEQGEQPSEAFAWSLLAAERAARICAPAEEWRALDRACRLWPHGHADDDVHGHVDLLRRTAEAARLAGQLTAAVDRLREAIELVDRDRDPLLASTLLVAWAGRRWDAAPGVPFLCPELHQAVALAARVPGSPEHALAVTELAIGHVWDLVPEPADDLEPEPADGLEPRDPPVPGRFLARRAVRLAQNTGSPRALSRALCALAIAELDLPGSGPLERLQQAYDLAVVAGDPLTMGFAAIYWQHELIQEGRYEEQVDVAARFARELGEAGDTVVSHFLLACAGSTLITLGQWAQGEALLRPGLALGMRGLGGISSSAATVLAVRRGRAGAAKRLLDRLTEVLEPGFLGWGIAQPYCEYFLLVGEPAQALAYLRHRHDAGGWRDHSGAMHPALAAAAAADLAEQARDRQDAAGVIAAVNEMRAVTALFDAHLGDVGAYPNDERQDRGWRALMTAERARCTAAADEAAAWLAAREAYRESRFPWEEAYCGWRLAAALVREGALRAQVGGVLREAYAIAEGLGAAPLVSRLEAVARAARVRLDAVPTLDTARRTGSPLSEREHQVLTLVIAGRTNAEIAAALFLSEATVKAHVSRILTRLDLNNRVQIAMLVYDAELR